MISTGSVRHLDWNMLNQVFVFGYFHADLHPANIFVLPGDAIGYVDFGIVGQLPNRVRESLIRYSWLLFRGEIEAAVRELMRWLAPTAATDTTAAQWQLIRVHQAFLYEAPADRSRVTSEAPGPISANRENPSSKLAVEILETIRDQRLTMSPSIVAYLKMLVTLGALRHQLARSTTTSRTTSGASSGGWLASRDSSWLDPRLALDRVYAGDRADTAGLRFRRVPRVAGIDHRRGRGRAVRLPAPDAIDPAHARPARRGLAHGRGAAVLRAGRSRGHAAG